MFTYILLHAIYNANAVLIVRKAQSLDDNHCPLYNTHPSNQHTPSHNYREYNLFIPLPPYITVHIILFEDSQCLIYWLLFFSFSRLGDRWIITGNAPSVFI